MIWRSKFRFKSVIWRESDKYSIQNAPLKLWSLKPATCTQPEQLWLSETNRCCHLLPGVDVNWAVAPWQSTRSSSLCQGARLLLSTPTQFGPVKDSLSSVGFDPIFGCTARMHKWVDCWLRQCGASTGGMKMQISYLGSPIRLKTCCHSSSFCYHVESTDCVL